jgi:uncharacterized protein DUF3987
MMRSALMTKDIEEIVVNGSAKQNLGSDSGGTERTHQEAKQENEWPEPILLSDNPVDQLRADILPDTLGEYSESLSRFTETPSELSTLAILGVVSVAAAGKVEVEAEQGYKEPANLYLSPLLESGNRKTQVMTSATAPLLAFEMDERQRMAPEIAKLQSELKTKQSAIEKLRKGIEIGDEDAIRRIAELEQTLPVVPQPRTLFTTDCTADALKSCLQRMLDVLPSSAMKAVHSM